MTEIHIPNFDEEDDLAPPVFPPTHSSSNSFDSTSGSPGGPTPSYSKRSASPFLRKKKPRADSTESSTRAGGFAFPHAHPASPVTHNSGQGQVGAHYTKVSAMAQTPPSASASRPTFQQRSASHTQSNLTSHLAHPSPISGSTNNVPGSASSTSFFSAQSSHPTNSSGYSGFANLPTAGESSTSLSLAQPPNPLFVQEAQAQARPHMPAKKGSFANLKNAFKAATSGKSAGGSSSSNLAGVAAGAGAGHGQSGTVPSGVMASPTTPIHSHNQNSHHTQPHQPGPPSMNPQPNGLPALRNPFHRSFSSNALPPPVQPMSAGVHGHTPTGMSLRSVERSGSASGSGFGLGQNGVVNGSGNMNAGGAAKTVLGGGKMYRVKDKPVSVSTASQYQPTASRKIGIGASSNRQRQQHRQQGSITTASSVGSGSVGSRYNGSMGGGGGGISMVREEEAVPPSSAFPGKRASHGYSSSDHSQHHHHHHHNGQQPDRTAAENFVIPTPQSPGEIVMHELFRRFASRSSDKLDLVISQPLLTPHPAPGWVSQGRDTGYDDLLRSVGAVGKDYPKQVVDFVLGWAKSQGRAEQQEDGAGKGRMGEVERILSERRATTAQYIAHRTFSEMIRQNDRMEQEMLVELEENVFDAYAALGHVLPACPRDQAMLAEIMLEVLRLTSAISSNSIAERFLGRLANELESQEVVDVTNVRHLLKGLLSLPDSVVLSTPGTLGTLGMLFAQSGSTSVREAFTLELLPLLKRMENLPHTSLEPFTQAISTISSQADRLATEPGLWSVAFPLSVTCLNLAPLDEHERAWQFRLDQAAGMLKSPQHRACHSAALAGMLRIVRGCALHQTTSNNASGDLFAVIQRVTCGGQGEGLLALSEAASDVLEELAGKQVPPRHVETTQDATVRMPTKAAEASRTFASVSLAKDDTLGDLVGTLHQLNQFFTEDDDVFDVDNDMITPVRHGRMRTTRPAGSRGTSMSSTEWNHRQDSLMSPSESAHTDHHGLDLETSSDSDASPQVEAWRYVGGASASRHRTQPSMSSSGSAQRGKNMFDLEEEFAPDYASSRETPRHNNTAPQPRKPGQLRTLMLGGGGTRL